jgi:hypothetical protein
MTFRVFHIQIGPHCANVASVAQRNVGSAGFFDPHIYIDVVLALLRFVLFK